MVDECDVFVLIEIVCGLYVCVLELLLCMVIDMFYGWFGLLLCGVLLLFGVQQGVLLCEDVGWLWCEVWVFFWCGLLVDDQVDLCVVYEVFVDLVGDFQVGCLFDVMFYQCSDWWVYKMQVVGCLLDVLDVLFGDDVMVDLLIEVLQDVVLLVDMLCVFGWFGQGGMVEGKCVVIIELVVIVVCGIDVLDEVVCV